MAKVSKQKAVFKYNAKVLSVIDGDTIKVTIDLGFDVLINATVRLYGINTNELKSKDAKLRESAIDAKVYLSNRLIGKTVVAETFINKKEKYGRYLANIYLNDILINTEMINKGYAVAYMI